MEDGVQREKFGQGCRGMKNGRGEEWMVGERRYRWRRSNIVIVYTCSDHIITTRKKW
jgi:hypothetical protein